MPFRLNNRLDIKDECLWREAVIVGINGNFIKVHFKSFSNKYDE